MINTERDTQQLRDRMFSQGENMEQLDFLLNTIVIYPGQARKIEDVRRQSTELIKHDAGNKPFKKSDEVLSGHFPNRFRKGISHIILAGSEQDFKDNLQLIILLNDFACTRVLEQEKSFRSIPRSNIVGTAGQSLGIISALKFSGAIDEETLSLIGVERHDAMRDAPGTLVGFYANDSDERIEELKKKYGLETSIRTSSGFVVLGGEKEVFVDAIREAKEKGIKFIPLDTDGAFHTSRMERCVKRLEELFNKIKIKDAEMNIFANRLIYKSSDIREELIYQTNHTVAWEESVSSMINQAQQFIEIGSNGTLTGHIERDMGKRYPEEKSKIIKRQLRNKEIALANIGSALIIPRIVFQNN